MMHQVRTLLPQGGRATRATALTVILYMPSLAGAMLIVEDDESQSANFARN
jgi:hypothetical protein